MNNNSLGLNHGANRARFAFCLGLLEVGESRFKRN